MLCHTCGPYISVQVSTVQLGVARLLGLGLLVCTIDMWPEPAVRHVAGGGIFGLARHSVGGDVVINAGTTWLPLDLWSLDQRYTQR